MPSRAIHHEIQVKRAISPVSVSDNTARVSEIIDTSGYDSAEFIIALGSIADADATFTVLVEDGDNSALSDNAAVADDFLVGTEAEASFTFASDDQVRKIGYKGPKRYIRLTITPASNASAALIAAVAVLSHPALSPVTQATA
jgi:hypothetical protein